MLRGLLRNTGLNRRGEIEDDPHSPIAKNVAFELRSYAASRLLGALGELRTARRLCLAGGIPDLRMIEGLEQAPRALIGLLRGEAFGKRVIHINA